MSDYNSYVSLKRIVSYFLDEKNLSIGDFDKAWIIAFRGLQLLNQSIAAEPKSVKLPVNGNKTVDFPTDMLSWTKIGIMTDGGQISTLKINNALSTLKDTNPNRISYLEADINSNVNLLINTPYYFNYNYNGIYQTLFGVGGGLIQYGECRVDERNRVIILSPDFKYDSILVEYLSSPQNDEDYEIQTVLQEAVIAFIAWKFNLGKREDFYGAATEGRRALPGKKVTLQRVNQVIRETSGMYLKG